MTTSSGGSNSSSFIVLILILWFIFDTSARGLIYPSILDFSWFEMAGLDCSELDEIEELLPGLVSECGAQKQEAALVTAGGIFCALFVMSGIMTKKLYSAEEEDMRLSLMLEDEMNAVASHLIKLDKRLESLENERLAQFQRDWEQEFDEEDTE
jgi:hypothetical protein